MIYETEEKTVCDDLCNDNTQNMLAKVRHRRRAIRTVSTDATSSGVGRPRRVGYAAQMHGSVLSGVVVLEPSHKVNQRDHGFVWKSNVRCRPDAAAHGVAKQVQHAL
jgi:hypothetical protein